MNNREDIHRYWESRSTNDDKNNPREYLNKTARSQFLFELLDSHAEYEDSILEVGCNVGRNLNYIHSENYTNVHGIEINPEAISILECEYSEMAADATIHNSSVEKIITKFDSDEFDVVFTMAVLEHIHPKSEWIFDEMARICGDVLITVEDEGSNTTRHEPRNYGDIFSSLGYREVKTIHQKDFPEGVVETESFVARVFEQS
ncbi:class I SAM-dependent methyltransferase [Halonotius sp. GCM10025705]|uniref:class I SAM-dependent methyltransferase n=1 Tax=Halonotius sp. GCM10025705 TaxID=3252678 RepID=UPI003611DDC4